MIADSKGQYFGKQCSTGSQKETIQQQPSTGKAFILLAPPQDREQTVNNEFQPQKIQLISRLKGILHQKVSEVKAVKRSIARCKQQIKTIGQDVDKQVNKSLLKHSKPYSTVNIRSIFTNPKNSSPEIGHLKSQLATIQGQSKKVKIQIKTRQQTLQAPTSIVNQERASVLRVQLKEVENELRIKTQQKKYLQEEIKMMKMQGSSHNLMGQEEILQSKQTNSDLLAGIKQERNTVHRLDKQDRLFTEKIRYLSEIKTKIGTRGKTKSPQNQEIKESIKELISDINQIIAEKNKVERDRKISLNKLIKKARQMQQTNWELIHQLRNLDKQLLSIYSSKNRSIANRSVSKDLKVKKNRKQSKLNTEISQTESLREYQSTKAISEIARNDKNMVASVHEEEEVVLMEKRRNYDFFMAETKEDIILGDQPIANQFHLESIMFIVDERYIYGFQAEYTNEGGRKILGHKIMPKIRPKETSIKHLRLSQHESMNFICIGNDQEGYIRFLKVITSEGNEFKWGGEEECCSFEQKNLRKYQSLCLKGKLTQITDRDAPNYYCLGGLSCCIVYLAPR